MLNATPTPASVPTDARRAKDSAVDPGKEPAGEADVAAAVEMATAQLEQYLADERLARQFPGVRFIGLIVVFHGWKMLLCDAVRR